MVLCLLLLLGTQVVQAVRHATRPPFAPGLPDVGREHLQIAGLELLVPPVAGVTRLRVERVRPGHERLGPFWFGIPTHLDLSGVTVIGPDAAGAEVSCRCQRGRWDADGVHLMGPVLCESGSGASLAERVRVGDDGVIRVR